jgi:syntaxin 16
LFVRAQNKVKELSNIGTSSQTEAFAANLQNSFAQKLQERSIGFRKSQSRYLKTIRKQEYQGAAKQYINNDDDLDSVFLDAKMAVSQSNDKKISQREKEINDVAHSIMTIADLFRELQTMVLAILMPGYRSGINS